MTSTESDYATLFLAIQKEILGQDPNNGITNLFIRQDELVGMWRQAWLALAMCCGRVAVLSDNRLVRSSAISELHNMASEAETFSHSVIEPLRWLAIDRYSEYGEGPYRELCEAQGFVAEPPDTDAPALKGFAEAAHRFLRAARAIAQVGRAYAEEAIASEPWSSEELASFCTTYAVRVLHGAPEHRQYCLRALRRLLDARPDIPRGVVEPLTALAPDEVTAEEWAQAQQLCRLLNPASGGGPSAAP